MCEQKQIPGGVTAPLGFRAACVCAGIRQTERPDLALLVSDPCAAAAAVFTTNRVQAAPVLWCRERLKGGRAAAVLINSGNANACTGEHGRNAVAACARRVAEVLSTEPEAVWVCSTGTIGIPLPVEAVLSAIEPAAAALAPDGGGAAALAIMTTDTVPKEHALGLTIEGVPVRVGGMAKGAGMIAPNMATMLGFLTTDAAVAPDALQACLRDVAACTFNKITVDGDQSTNDTLLLLANGAAGGGMLDARHPEWDRFRAAVECVARALALKLVADGEGATKVATVRVHGARSDADAARAVRAVAESLLVKTAWYGGDPNWGRIIAALGYSGADIDPERVSIAFDGVAVVRDGCLAPGASLRDLELILRKPRFSVEIGLHLGPGEDTMYSCDCSTEYVKINAAYMT
jgi:glutamate N-acetyltransferase / amino-acid N-acetyltransferase